MIDIHYKKKSAEYWLGFQLGYAELLITSKKITLHPLLHLLLLFCNIHTTTKSVDISLSFKLNEFVSLNQSE
jgi:hypothetical protein